MELNELIERNAYTALSTQGQNGEMPPGHNGPYNDPETTVRNTAHWLVTFSHLYDVTGAKKWRFAGYKAVDHLLSESLRPAGASFLCRRNVDKDGCNGLIGQAWALEGLTVAARLLQREDARKTAAEVYFLHPFVEERSIWRKVEVDGRQLAPDDTFNHQLWFAATGCLINDKEADRRATRFLDRVASSVQIYPSGIVFHKSLLGNDKLRAFRTRDAFLRQLETSFLIYLRRRTIAYKSVGYHPFNLYAFALLKRHFPYHPLWNTAKMARMLDATRTDKFKRHLSKSIYGYPYNPPGLELAFVGEVFELGRDYSQDWILAQVASTYDADSGELLKRGVSDSRTLSARLYEATRLNDDYTVTTDDRVR